MHSLVNEGNTILQKGKNIIYTHKKKQNCTTAFNFIGGT